MRRPIPESERQAALELLRHGRTAVDAARITGVNVNTIRSWTARERIGARTAGLRPVPPAAGGPALQVDEFEQLLADRCRAGSVAALRLWCDLHRSEFVRPVAEADQLARLREAHRSAEERHGRPVGA